MQNISSVAVLNKIQRKSLSLCLGVPARAALNSLAAETSVLRLNLCREVLSIRETVKIIAKDNSQIMKQIWNGWRDDYRGKERYMSPFGLADLQLQDLDTNTGISIIKIETEFSSLEGMAPSKYKPEYWNRLCSSKSRSTARQEESKETVQALVENCKYDEIVAFTDGSCLGNLGPCRSWDCIYLPNQTESVRLKRLVTNRGSLLLGELIVILMALEFAQNEYRKRQLYMVLLYFQIVSQQWEF